MELFVDHVTSEAKGQFGHHAVTLTLGLEGRKKWNSSSALRFETTEHNLRQIRELFPHLTETDMRQSVDSVFDGFQSASTYLEAEGKGRTEKSTGDHARPQERTFEAQATGDWPFRMPPYDFQLENFERFKDQRNFAIFSDPGCGKTRTAIDIISYRFQRKMITGVLVFSAPKGVHTQWIRDQIPKHLWPGIEVNAAWWDGKVLPAWVDKVEAGKLHILSANIDAVVHERSREQIWRFVRAHRQNLFVIVDESDTIKNASAKRSKEARLIGLAAGWRAIMTGTPIAKNLLDEFSQFKFLSEGIIGIRYKSAFQAMFCKMGGWEGKVVIGHRNLDQFKRLTEPYIFRATKAELHLPEKVYDQIVFEMSEEQQRHTKALKQNFLTKLESGEIASVTNAASLVTRLQQISNGIIVDEEGNVHRTKENPRLSTLLGLLEKFEGQKVAIWCRFNADVELLKETFGDDCVTLYGKNTSKEREAAKHEFIEGKVTKFIANPAAGGKGIDGLQHVCSAAIYYSNSFNFIERVQSEDRTHRIGTKSTSFYFDLIARGSPDRGILRNLRDKKNLSALVLGDIKELIEDI